MKEFWTGLSSRERLLVTSAAGLFAVFVFLQFILAPFMDWRRNSIQKAERAEDLYTLVSQAGAIGAGAARAGDVDLETPLRNVLTQTARLNSIDLNFVNARPDGSVDASAGATDPDRLFAWFAALERDYGVSIVAADISRENDETGLVRMQATFAR